MVNQDLRNIIGENIRYERLLRKMSIDELAELLDCTPGFIGLIERGKRGATVDTLKKLSEVFQIPVDDIIFRENVFTSFCEPKNELREARISTLNSVIHNLDCEEIDFIIEVIRNLKSMKRAKAKAENNNSEDTQTDEHFF